MSNKQNLTREDLITYYIDALGYSAEDIANETFGDLLALLNNAQLSECLQYNNITI
jgi:hypothetical protein